MPDQPRAESLAESLSALFPHGAAVAASTDGADPATLWPSEYGPVAKAIQKRQREFAGGRSCARAALRALGYPDMALPSREDRRPQWPEGVVGSITHTTGLCAAVAAPAARLAGVGVDAELRGRVREHLYPQICTPGEAEWLKGLTEDDRADMAALVFSAKEAFYKAQYTLTEQFLGFDDARLELLDRHGDSGRFAIHLTRETRLTALRPGPVAGRFVLLPGVIVTGVSFEAA